MNATADVYASRPRWYFVQPRTFEGKLNICIGRGEEVTLLYRGSAHTAGDMIVSLPAESVAFIDGFDFAGHEPLIQDKKGGNSFKLVRVRGILLNIKPEDRAFIPSHADPVGRAVVDQIPKSIKGVLSKVTTMFNERERLG
jgi:hypothetical protein